MLGLLTVAVAATIWGASVVTNAQLPNLAANLHARTAVPLESASATLHQAGAQAHKDFTGTV